VVLLHGKVLPSDPDWEVIVATRSLTQFSSALGVDFIPLFGLGPDYIVTQTGNGWPTGSLDLRKVGDMPTSLSTYALSNEFPDSACMDNNGHAFVIMATGSVSGGTKTMKKVKVANGALKVTAGGALTVPSGTTTVGNSWAAPAGLGVICEFYGTDYITGYDPYDYSVNWTNTTQAGHTGFTGRILATVDGWGFLHRCSIHGAIEYWAGRNYPTACNLRGSISLDGDLVNYPTCVPIDANGVFICYPISGDRLRYGLLNLVYNSGLSWAWGPYTTSMDLDTNAVVVITAYQNLVAIAPHNLNNSDIPMYIVDTKTQNIWQSPALPWVGETVYNQPGNFIFTWSKRNYLTFMDVFSGGSWNNIYSLKYTVTYPVPDPVPPTPFAWNADF
jgi:hypothetical protein